MLKLGAHGGGARQHGADRGFGAQGVGLAAKPALLAVGSRNLNDQAKILIED